MPQRDYKYYAAAVSRGGRYLGLIIATSGQVPPLRQWRNPGLDPKRQVDTVTLHRGVTLRGLLLAISQQHR